MFAENTTCPGLTGNTHEQNSCEFHQSEIDVKEQCFNAKDKQQLNKDISV